MTPTKERIKAGKSLRHQVPRNSHGVWAPGRDRPDPVSLLQAQDEGRLEYLLPIKYGRMVESPFAFLRGSAAVMATDLATTPTTGLQVQLCGDAHLSNFGIFATPERKLVFDINDFDETQRGPWEWDLKRLAASAVVAGRQNGFSDDSNRQLALVVPGTYRQAMRHLAEMRTLDVWYYDVAADTVLVALEQASKMAKRSARKMVKNARKHSQVQTLGKLTEVVGGRRKFLNDPPLLVRLSEAMGEEATAQISEEDVESLWMEYLYSLPEERRLLLSRFRIADGALRVGGIGSVGTRCTIVLLEGEGEDDALVLQQKEAGPSVLEPHVTGRQYANQAHRVVVGQRLMQAASDIFLGWHQGRTTGRYYYWRQLKDMKASLDVAALDEAGLRTYLVACSACLARAHARTGDAAAIAGYAGRKGAFDRAVADFALAYADQTEHDYQALVDAVAAGCIVAEAGV